MRDLCFDLVKKPAGKGLVGGVGRAGVAAPMVVGQWERARDRERKGGEGAGRERR